MELRMPAVAALFEQVGRQTEEPVSGLFLEAARQMNKVTGRPPQTALRMALEQAGSLWDREETGLLLELGGALGRYDLCGQARVLELLKNRLDRMIAENERVLVQRAKAWMTASVCSGAAVIVILL